jgi:hypothetical protein
MASKERSVAMSAQQRRFITAAAFVLSAAGTVLLLALLAALGPFTDQTAPPLAWSIVLWGMVGVVTFVLMMRVVLLALVTLAGVMIAGKKGALAAAHLLKVTIGLP